MKRILLKFPDGRSYLVGFTTNLAEFIRMNYKEYILPGTKFVHSTNHVSFYHTRLKENISLLSIEITDGEKCFYKAV